MPDFDAVLSAVRTRLEALGKRRDALRRELGEVDAEHMRLSSAISVLEEHLPAASPQPSAASFPVSPSVPEEPLPEKMGRVFRAIDFSGVRRAELLRRVVAPDLDANAVDGALTRLKQRGLIRRRGRIILPAQPSGEVSAPSASVRADASVETVETPSAES